MAATRNREQQAASPKDAAVRSARLEVRITALQKALIERAAAYEGRSITDFVVGTAAAAAAAVVHEHEVVRLDPSQGLAFVESLLNPRPPNTALRSAVRRSRRSVESR